MTQGFLFNKITYSMGEKYMYQKLQAKYLKTLIKIESFQSFFL